MTTSPAFPLQILALSESRSWATESTTDISDFPSDSDEALLTPDELQREQRAVFLQRHRFQSWKDAVTEKRRHVPPPPTELEPMNGGIEAQLPSFLFPTSNAEFAPFPIPSPETSQPLSPVEVIPENPSPKPVPPRASISAWSTPLPARVPPPTAITPSTRSAPAYPNLAAIARSVKERTKDHGKGKATKTSRKAIQNPPTPPLQPIYDDWTVAQPVTSPAKSRGGKVVQVDWGMEAMRMSAQQASRRQAVVAAGGEDPYGGW